MIRYGSADFLQPAHVGSRVTVRRRLDEGGLGDVVGTLEMCDERLVIVRDRRGGLVRIDRADVVAARVHGRQTGR